MTMVAEKTRYANRNMRQDRKVGKESVWQIKKTQSYFPNGISHGQR